MKVFGWPIVLCLLSLLSSAGASDQGRQLLWQSNASGDDIHIIDIQTGELTGKLVAGPEPHGLAATADGRTVFTTIEANGRRQGELAWIDAGSLKVMRRHPICREPHALAVTHDGQWLYVPCRDGRYWVVNGHIGEIVKQISTGGRPHNTQISRDGRLAFLSPMGGTHEADIGEARGRHHASISRPGRKSGACRASAAAGGFVRQGNSPTSQLGSVARNATMLSRDVVNAKKASRSLIGQSTALRRRARDDQDALRLVASRADAFKTLV